MIREKKKLLFLSLLLVPVFFCCLFVTQSAFKLELLSLGHGRYITFFNHWYDVESCHRVFQIRDKFGRVINDGCFVLFCDEPEQNKNEVISSEDGNLVGILDYQLYPPLFIMCDFSTGKCSPCDTTELEENIMLERLKKYHSGLP